MHEITLHLHHHLVFRKGDLSMRLVSPQILSQSGYPGIRARTADSLTKPQET